ncbi:MAG: SEC-C domain-containing protein [Hamadaea sp.]|nr:SEC-C domain-containing protein [Hamadaea sp.]
MTEPRATKLTLDDLTDISEAWENRSQAAKSLRELLDAVDNDRLVDPADTVTALTMAAEAAGGADDAKQALALAQRAVRLADESGDEDLYPRGILARFLARTGDRDAAQEILDSLRAALTTDDAAPPLVVTVAEELGEREVALRWLDEALDTVAPNREELPEPDEGFEQALQLLLSRHDLREDLGLPHDIDDERTDRIKQVLSDLAHGELDLVGPVCFFPEAELASLFLRLPGVTDLLGSTWDGHRSMVQRLLTDAADAGQTGLTVIAGTAEGYATFAETRELDPLDEGTLNDYADELAETQPELPWPPGRNEVCWCGSGQKYKKCCLRR